MKSFQIFLIILQIISYIICATDNILIPWTTSRRNIKQLQQDYLKKFINHKANKCEEFKEFVCGNWGKYYNHTTDPYNAIRSISDDIKLIVYKVFSDSRLFSRFRFEHPVRMAKEYFDSCMDLKTIRSVGYKPLVEFMKKFEEFPALNSNSDKQYDWLKTFAKLKMYGSGEIMQILVDVDFREPGSNVIYIDQVDNSSPLEESRSNAEKLLGILGVKKEIATKALDGMIEFESALFGFVVDAQDRTHRAEIYDEASLQDLQNEFKNVNWFRLISFLRKKPADGTERFLVDKKYLTKLMPLLSKTSSTTILNYILTRFALSCESYIKTKDEDQSNDKNWWKTCARETMYNMDMAVANIFVRKFLRSRKRRDIDIITNDVKAKFIELLEDSNWIDSETKSNAIRKLTDMYFEVGFPEFITKRIKLKKWFDGVKIDPEKFFENTMALISLRYRRDLETLGMGKAYDTYDSPITTMGAHYDVGRNKITIQAGLLQLPYYHPVFPKYMKYGIVGSIVGHEMTHGFDNFGRLYDEFGQDKNWWSEESARAYRERSDCLVKQYEDYGVSNGNFSLLEIIADNVGLKISYLAYKDWVEHNQRRRRFQIRNEHVSGLNLTSVQLFFVAYVQWRCDNGQDVLSSDDDPHPDEPIRIRGSLANLKDFGESFNCPIGSDFNPGKKCVLW